MGTTSVNEDGSIGPFTDTAAAEEWLADRLVMLSGSVGQQGALGACLVAVDTAGRECVCPAIYDSSTDTVRMHYTSTTGDVFDVAAVDGMLLHALGHRARRAHNRILRALGWALAAATVFFAVVVVLEDVKTATDEPLTPAMRVTFGVLIAAAAFLVAAWGRYHWTAEAAADDYALDHGGPRPILTFLRRMAGDPVSESALPHARPASRIARIQARLWAGSTLASDMPVHRYGEPDRT